jgi:hypothetical protein
MGEKIVEPKVSEVPSTDFNLALNKSRNTALALESNVQLEPSTKELTDSINKKIAQLEVTSDPVLREKLNQSIDADFTRRSKLAAQNNAVITAPTASRDKEKAVNRESIEASKLITLEVTSFSVSSDSINEAITNSFFDDEGNVFNNERSTGTIPKPENIASLEIRSLNGNIRATIREFFITGVSENTSEKFQIVQTFGSDYVFFFNRKPLIYTINGVWHNSEDKQWKNNFRENYDNFLRGTKLVEGRNKAVLQYDDVTREGYLLALNYQMDAQNTHAVPFSFSMFITKESRTGQKRQTSLSKNQNSKNDIPRAVRIIA